MPTSWKRSPEELHKTYIANTEAFYKVAGRDLAAPLDEFISGCALELWKKSSAVTSVHVDTINELYSKGRPKPTWLLWGLTQAVCNSREFLPPLFFWALTEKDAKKGTTNSRIFIRMMTNILLYLAAADDDVSISEAEYITLCADNLSAICDSAGVKKGKPGIKATDYITSGEASFVEKHSQSSSPAPKTATQEEAKTDETAELEKPDLDELMAELDSLIGLETVKKEVKSLINLIRVRKLRDEAGLPSPDMSLHLVFTGNPGTGKTTVARLLGGIYHAIGVLKKGQLVEVDRSGLVAGFVGQTAIKTTEVINSAIGGILFIDEAYALTGGENDFGGEAIDTILKAMEDKRDNLIVIVAGYPEPMEEFLGSNPGLESRFNKYIDFADYNGEELSSIFDIRLKKGGYTLSEDASEYVKNLFNSMYADRDENFGNGRDVRNFFEDCIMRQANRLSTLESPTKDDLMCLNLEDLEVKPDAE